jgi:general secretion pathway protein J
MRATAHLRARRGFTLLEVLIAIAITGSIGAMVADSFRRASVIRDLTTEQEARFGGARVALTRIAQEVSEAYLSDHYDRGKYRERPTVFVGRDRGERDTLLFTTMAHARIVPDAKQSDQAFVEYSLESDPDRPDDFVLWRREKPHIDENADRGGSRARVLDNVRAFEVTYWDWKRQEWAREWSSTGVDHPNQLPTRVRIQLKVRMPDGAEQSFETQTRVAIIRPLDF